jgi:hypothetical protein
VFRGVEPMRSTKHLSAAITDRPIVALLAGITVALMLAACGPRDAGDNQNIMENAARSLEVGPAGNRAYMLEKIAGQASPIPGFQSRDAVFYGFIDNRFVCKNVAEYLMQRGDAEGDQYDCIPVD